MMSKTKIHEVGEVVRRFRRERKGQWLPAALWEKIFQLRSQHEVEEISEATGLSPNYLRRRFAKNSPLKNSPFYELKAESVMSAVEAERGTVVEVKRADGAAMTVRVGSEAELKAVLGAFVGT
jgi:hypothetical protein